MRIRLPLSSVVLATSLLLPQTNVFAQLSASAYRVLGQRDLRQNGLNMVQGLELNAPAAVALDTRNGQFRVYISDTGNHRVLAWQDGRLYQNGDPPALILGQSGRQKSLPMGIGSKGFNGPAGLAVHPSTGDLYVADSGNSRVLRFPDPFANPTRVEPDAVFGQPDFSRTVSGTTNALLNKPRYVAFDSAGNLWVADSGNHRVLRFPSAVLANTVTPAEADLVIAQKDFTSAAANNGGTVSASGLDTPAALTFDVQGNLYVSDLNNSRLLRFTPPFLLNAAASAVWGQGDFTSRGVSTQPSAATVATPAGLAVDNSGNLLVAVQADNRVLAFSTATPLKPGATNVLGQTDFNSTAANASSFPLASAGTLSGPTDVKVDPTGGVFVADTGNNRVLRFDAGSKTATGVWGQTDFAGNGPNQIKPGSVNAAAKVAVDYSAAPYALYMSDVNNHRVLVWKDSVRFRNGDPADLVIGQPDMSTAVANIDTRGSQNPSRTSLSRPRGIAVDQRDGTLYVADSGNNRVLRFPRPVNQTGRITPDAVLGQVDFGSSTSAAVSPATLRNPASVALGPDGGIFIVDTGNHRILEFTARSGTGASAIRVYGQPNMFSSVAPGSLSAQTLSSPQGAFTDAAYNLYVADTGANRILVFPNTQAAPMAGMPASFVIGQSDFQSGSGAGGTSFKTPFDVSVDTAGNIYVADFGNNRVVVFPALFSLPVSGATATGVIGQPDLRGTNANWNSPDGSPTPEGLYGPAGIYLDRQDTLYVADSGNSRVLQFLKPATVVNSAAYQAGMPVAPGSLVTLFGGALSDTSETAAGSAWPTSLAGRDIVINDISNAPLQYLSTTQANLQIPFNTPAGSGRIALRVAQTGELIAGGSLVIASASPGLFTSSQDGKGQAAAVNQDGRINSSSNPAARGTVVTLYGTGQGQVSPPVQDGMPAPAAPLSNTVTVPTSDGRACVTSQPSMCVGVGNTFGEVQYSGLAPGFIGLWQINIRIPADAPTGNAVPVRVLINGAPSNTVGIAVR